MFLQFPENMHLCFMSDRHKGLVKALQTHFPFASTRFYARHIYANFKSSYPGHNYKKIFWKASRSSNLFHFNIALDSIGEVDPKAKQWIMKIDKHLWSSMLGTHRAQTYLQLLEFIRRMVMRKLQERKEECEAWREVLPPRVNARIHKNSQASIQLTIFSYGDKEYELLGPDGTFPMKMKEYYCGCGSWQISGIPCPYTMVVISHSCRRRSLKDWVPNFVHQSLSKSTYIQTYRGMIHPLPDQNMWPTIETDELLPPPYATQPGRPKLQRKRESKRRKNLEQKDAHHHSNLSQQLQPQHHHSNLNQQLHQVHNHHLIRKQR
ncbi:hypothetical protein Ddye_028298 [Dipteronia dyeriana]|uniref:SWIM-type domain-containing protein n=1 Tax=Dipteronia dyeriana TaxID=168575 RepID=A0AAD9WS69_9ROSI|nr:hypothetical protein Ddye_028298 [Dipteronia dyeriana]